MSKDANSENANPYKKMNSSPFCGSSHFLPKLLLFYSQDSEFKYLTNTWTKQGAYVRIA